MRHDPLFTSWLVKCSSAEESQRLQQRLRAALGADTAYADIVQPSPKGTESSATIAHRLGDYFTDIRLLPGEPAGPLTFRIVFARRADAGRFWKDLMVRTLQEIRMDFPGATTTLEYQGDKAPETLGANGGQMMEVGSYKFHRRASMALNQLAADEQAHVLETLAGLVDTPAVQWPAQQAKRLPGEPPLYLVRIDDSLRAIVSAADGQEPEVMDIVRRETLEFFAKSAANSDH